MIQLNKQSILIGVAVLAIIITGVLISANGNSNTTLSFLKFNFFTSPKGVAEKAVAYLNSKVLLQGQSATLNSFSEESGVIKVNIKITSADGSKDYNSYITKDGKLFFPDVLVLGDSKNQQPSPSATTSTPATLAKVDKPMLEAYVVSDCPFGLQMQRVMDNAIANIPSLGQYLKVRYIGSVVNGAITSMHGDKEAQENLRQICLRDEQASKYWAYVSCYMRKGDSTACQVSEKIDANKLSACMTDSKRGLAYAKEDFDLNTKYNIQGSPTLILNGTQVSEFDFGGRASNTIKTLICNSSSKEPDFCSTALNTETAATSFSLTYAGSGSSANNAANCAPATN